MLFCKQSPLQTRWAHSAHPVNQNYKFNGLQSILMGCAFNEINEILGPSTFLLDYYDQK